MFRYILTNCKGLLILLVLSGLGCDSATPPRRSSSPNQPLGEPGYPEYANMYCSIFVKDTKYSFAGYKWIQPLSGAPAFAGMLTGDPLGESVPVDVDAKVGFHRVLVGTYVDVKMEPSKTGAMFLVYLTMKHTRSGSTEWVELYGEEKTRILSGCSNMQDLFLDACVRERVGAYVLARLYYWQKQADLEGERDGTFRVFQAEELAAWEQEKDRKAQKSYKKKDIRLSRNKPLSRYRFILDKDKMPPALYAHAIDALGAMNDVMSIPRMLELYDIHNQGKQPGREHVLQALKKAMMTYPLWNVAPVIIREMDKGSPDRHDFVASILEKRTGVRYADRAGWVTWWRKKVGGLLKTPVKMKSKDASAVEGSP